MSVGPVVTEHWCLGLDAGPRDGLCLHCETCGHVWRGQPGAIVHPPGRIVLHANGSPTTPRVVECALRRPLEGHAASVGLLPRQVRGADASPVTARDRAADEVGGAAM